MRLASAALAAADPLPKANLTLRAWQEYRMQDRGEPLSLEEPPPPGRPRRPALVPPRELPRRSLATPEGHAALIHAVVHIEFNAINLALDAALRFPGMPEDYYRDWLRVAAEEARHFGLLSEHLSGLGWRYGDFEAHNGLWELAMETAGDPLHRMALIPRCMEARGLDVNPGMARRLRDLGDDDGADILDLILEDEIGHVAVGDRWFRHFCRERGLEAGPTYLGLVLRYLGKVPRGALHHRARLAAGFDPEELARLDSLR
ncbi:MAG: DUF455 family protein [Gammaproteobacteria bacterium]|nr:MAG: DUF455 family protein [Gammaproteobacteria bacterium]